MAQRRKFKSAATSRRFKSVGQGLRAAEERIKEQRQGELEGIKLAQLQHKENSNAFLSGLNSKQNFEEGVLREKHSLEQKVREHKYQALSKKAETDVKRLEDQYKDAKAKADWWADFAPTFASNLGKLAQGSLQFADSYRGQKQWEALKASGILEEMVDQKSEANLQLSNHITQDGFQLEPNEGNALHRSTYKVNTHWASKRLSQWFKENKDLIRSDAIAAYEGLDNKGQYGESNAIEVQKFNAYQLLKKLKVSPTSAGGKEIMEMATSLGVQDQKLYGDIRRVGETNNDIEQQLKTLKSLDPKSDEFKTNLFQLSHLYRNGWFKDDRGNVSSPYDNRRSIADGIELSISAYIEANIDNLTLDQVDELLKIDTPVLKPGEKAVPFDQRHGVRAEKIRAQYLKLKEQRVELLKNEKTAEGLAEYKKLKEDFSTDAWKKDDNFKDKPNGQKLWRLAKLNEIKNNKKYDDKTRNLAYELLNFDPDKHKLVDQYTYIRKNLIEGNVNEALQKFNSLNDTQKRDITEEIELFQEINNAHPQGINGIIADHKSLLLGEQKANKYWGGNELGKSAVETHHIMNQKWWDKVQEYKKQPDMTAARAVELANAWIQNEWDKGETLDTHWLYRVPGKKPGEKVSFPNQMDTNSKILAESKLIESISEKMKPGQGENMVYTTEEAEYLITNAARHQDIPGYDGDLISLLISDEFVNKSSLKQLHTQIENLIANKKAFGGTGNVNVGDLNIPPNVEVFVKHYRYPPGHPKAGKQMSKAMALKELFKKNGIDIKVLQGPDAAKLINNDKIGYNHTTDLGTTYYKTALNQKILPQRPAVREYMASIKSGTDKNTALLNLFTQRTGIEFKQLEDGRYAFSDTQGALKNGGLNIPLNTTPMQLLEGFGFHTMVTNQVDRINKRDKFNKRLKDAFILGSQLNRSF